VAVTSSPEKAAVARAAGAHDTVPADGFRAAVTELTGGRGVDVMAGWTVDVRRRYQAAY